MSFFSRKQAEQPAVSRVVGGNVSVTSSTFDKKHVEFRYQRAQSRVFNLKHKLNKLNSREPTEEVLASIEETKTAIVKWEKVLKIAKFELTLEEGE